MTQILCVLGTALLTTSCASWFRAPSAKSERYHIASPDKPWQPIDGGGADRAYQNPENNASLSINSVCNQYQALSLEELTKQLFVGSGQPEVVSSKNLVVDKFPGLESKIRGEQGGSVYEALYTVVRSEDCVYDILLVAPEGHLEANIASYQAIVGSLRETKKL